MKYKDFLASKAIVDIQTGFTPKELPPFLKDFQRDIVRWACIRGRSAILADCGMGKTIMQLAWGNEVTRHTNGDGLILAPLGVTRQTVREAEKFGLTANLAKDYSEVKPGINITNYEKLHKFDLTAFSWLVLDESSILKSFTGSTRTAIIDAARRVQYKLACTATPAPNDYIELGNHAEFLGVMSRTEMLSTFFVHDGGETSEWRLKGHAETDFWKWLCSWAVNIRKPSDLGYSDEGYTLPPLNVHEHIVESHQTMDGFLFALPAHTLKERRLARKASLNERVEKAASLAKDDRMVFWCNLNDESEAIADAVDGEEIRGSTSEDERERIMLGFLDGSVTRIVTKSSLWGFGLNLQCCCSTALVGVSDSFEEYYQILRRFWRFGQPNPVSAHVIISSLEGAVLANLKRKEVDANRMSSEMIKHMASLSSESIKCQTRETISYSPTKRLKLPNFMQ